MKRKTLFWAVLLGLLAAVCAGFYFVRPPSAGTLADIYVEGTLYRTVDLSAVAVPYTFTVETEYGYNTIEVSPGAIRVLEADCDEQICVNQGTITDSLIPITCLPHRLVIQIREPEP